MIVAKSPREILLMKQAGKAVANKKNKIEIAEVLL